MNNFYRFLRKKQIILSLVKKLKRINKKKKRTAGTLTRNDINLYAFFLWILFKGGIEKQWI